MRRVTLYTRHGCHLCDSARFVIEQARKRVEFTFDTIDIDTDAALRDRYNEDVPVVAIDGRDLFRWAVDLDSLVARLKA